VFRTALTALFLLCTATLGFAQVGTDQLSGFLRDIAPSDLHPDAIAYGPARADIPVIPLRGADGTVGWVYLTSDFVSTIGYSGKPIHVVAALDKDAVITGVRLVEHAEPIILIGIPDRKIRALTERFAGIDLRIEAAEGGTGHELEIISGATVTIIIIDDSIVRGGLKVARALGLGGLAPPPEPSGPRFEIDPEIDDLRTWQDLSSDGALGRLTLDIGQVNDAYSSAGDLAAAARPEPGDPSDTFIDMHAALVSVPSIGRSLMGDAEYGNLVQRLKEGENALLVAGRGPYSFKGSGYVRGGLFDRIQLIQGDDSTRFRDRQHQRLGKIAAAGAPVFKELDIFVIPADSGFDPVAPWRLQLLVQRATGPVKKSFLTFDLTGQVPQGYLRPAQVATAVPAPDVSGPGDEAAARRALWQRIWQDRAVDIGILLGSIGLLTGFFFFQQYLTRNETLVFWFRIGFLAFTLLWIGWYANAQLSVVNILALMSSLAGDFSWDAFLIDPLVFILWCSVAASILFWGRGAYCGWLCPFGALQELTNRLAKLARIPQVQLPWGLHERLWSLKYVIFLALFGLSIYSLPLAEQYAEVEPFKTAIILKFQRSWPFLLFVGVLLGAGLFIERFYCRYLCPLGAALAIPSKIRVFEWLHRYRECGSPCARCAKECMVQAIDPRGQINANECLYCMHCQVLYQHDQKCPVCIKKREKREAFFRRNRRAPETVSPLASVT
jgi:NosR/NirI family nitrous oxide reductase transcriptional regulator